MYTPNNTIIKKKREQTKNHFTIQEDENLKRLVMQFGDSNWQLISSFMPGRSVRQCRERYIGYLSPNLTTLPWTPQEDSILIQKLKEIGPKWTLMVPYFNGRSDSNIKNRWYKHLSKKADPAFVASVFNKQGKKAESSSPQQQKPKMKAQTRQIKEFMQLFESQFRIPSQYYNYVQCQPQYQYQQQYVQQVYPTTQMYTSQNNIPTTSQPSSPETTDTILELDSIESFADFDSEEDSYDFFCIDHITEDMVY